MLSERSSMKTMASAGPGLNPDRSVTPEVVKHRDSPSNEIRGRVAARADSDDELASGDRAHFSEREKRRAGIALGIHGDEGDGHAVTLRKPLAGKEQLKLIGYSRKLGHGSSLLGCRDGNTGRGLSGI